MEIHNIRAFIIDMDGVLWHGNRPLPGLAEFFAALRRRGARFMLATNNASQTPEQYVQKLAGFGIAIERQNILTSAQATALYLDRLLDGAPAAERRVFAIGDDGVRQALLERGFHLCGLYELDARYVVCGMDRGLSWDKLATATLNIRRGARFIGTNPDVTLPTEHGITQGNGAILAALQAATGVVPTIIGKPEPIMYQQAIALLGVEPEATAAIGDRLETDILGALRAGIASCLVLSGVTTAEQLARSEYQPTWVFPDIGAIAKTLVD